MTVFLLFSTCRTDNNNNSSSRDGDGDEDVAEARSESAASTGNSEDDEDEDDVADMEELPEDRKEAVERRGGRLVHSCSSSSPSDYQYFADLVQGSFPFSTATANGGINNNAVAVKERDEWAKLVMDWWRRRKSAGDSAGTTANGDHAGGRRARAKSGRRARTPTPEEQNGSQQESTGPSIVFEEQEARRLLSRPGSAIPNASTEQEGAILSYVRERHGGNVRQAVLGWQVDWTGGRAASARRWRKRRREGDDDSLMTDRSVEDDSHKVNGDNGHFVDEDSGSEADDVGPVLFGDFRKRKARSTPEPAPVVQKSKRSKRQSSNDSVELYAAVSAIGKALQQQVQEKPIVLSQIAAFIHFAEQLPPIPHVEDAKTKEGEVSPTQGSDELDTILSELRDALDLAEKHKAVLLDLWHKHGVDPDELTKQLEASSRVCDLESMYAEMHRQILVVAEWQTRAEEALKNATSSNLQSTERRDDLSTMEELAEEAKTHGFSSKGYVVVQGKIQKAWHVRDRIRNWQESKRLESIKFVAAIVRELGRLKILFPEAYDFLDFHREAEAWIDRANIAIRSKISLEEIHDLCRAQQEMHLDFSDLVDKLKMRAKSGQDWLEQFAEVVSVGADSPLECMSAIREVLQEGGHSQLHELASEGNRIPVEVDVVKLLQVELDAKSWTAQVTKCLPADDGESGRKKAKLEELEELVEKADALRDRLSHLPPKVRAKWVLDGEKELRSIVKASEVWFEKYEDVLDGDNRRNSRSCLSIAKLRQIAEEADGIFANLGPAGSKVSRLLASAEKWLEDHTSLLARCSLLGNAASTPATSDVCLSEMVAAVKAAKSDMSIDLKEAVQLEDLTKRIQAWFDSAAIVGGPKRHSLRNKKGTFTIDKLKELLEQSKTFPVNTTEEVQKLKEHLSVVEAWQSRAVNELEQILVGFERARETINESYGMPDVFVHKKLSADMEPSLDIQTNEFSDEKKASEDSSAFEASAGGSEPDSGMSIDTFFGTCNIHELILNFQKEATASCIETPEREIASELDSVWRWSLRSLKYLDSHRGIFDKRFFGAFDRFVAEGKELTQRKLAAPLGPEVNSRLRATWGAVVADQLQRLNVLVTERQRFMKWCDAAQQMLLNDGKRVSIERLRDHSKASLEFPPSCDMIKKIRDLEEKANSWIRVASEHLSSGEKLSLYEAKSLLDEGEKLGVQSNELKIIRNGLKAARIWENRLKRCKLEQGTACVADVKVLLEEHASMIVEMPEEVSKLEQAMRNYCICRRPYDGLMVACDHCDEWYHGPCVGVSQSRAGRITNYICLRCSVSKVFKCSTSNIVGIIRKWTCGKDRRKARQVEAQKHQRKIRKEKRDIEGFTEEQVQIRAQLAKMDSDVSSEMQIDPTQAVSDGPTANGASLADSENVMQREPSEGSSETDNNLAQKALVQDPPAIGTEESDAAVEDASSSNVTEKTTGNVSSTASAENRDAAEQQAQPSTSPAADGSTDAETTEIPSKESLESRLEEIAKSIGQCEERLAQLAIVGAERRKEEETEDASASKLKVFCLRVRARVLVPSSSQQAERSRPLSDGTISSPMQELIDEANKADISRFSDVQEIINSFKCCSWAWRAMSVVSKQPSADEVEKLVEQAADLTLPDEKALRMLKALSQRASKWNSKVAMAISPTPGEVEPYDVAALKDLAGIGDDIPLCMPIESRLLTVIEDNGARHCVCGGPSDGRFMLCCDGCSTWFHGSCVNVTKEVSEGLEEWKCPSCAGSDAGTLSLNVDKFHEKYDVEDERSDDFSVASEVKGMWPPYGLLGSEKAVEALGEECSAIADDFDPDAPPAVSVSSTSSVPVANGTQQNIALNPFGGARPAVGQEAFYHPGFGDAASLFVNPASFIANPHLLGLPSAQHAAGFFSNGVPPYSYPAASTPVAGQLRHGNPVAPADDAVSIASKEEPQPPQTCSDHSDNPSSSVDESRNTEAKEPEKSPNSSADKNVIQTGAADAEAKEVQQSPMGSGENVSPTGPTDDTASSAEAKEPEQSPTISGNSVDRKEPADGTASDTEAKDIEKSSTCCEHDDKPTGPADGEEAKGPMQSPASPDHNDNLITPTYDAGSAGMNEQPKHPIASTEHHDKSIFLINGIVSHATKEEPEHHAMGPEPHRAPVAASKEE